MGYWWDLAQWLEDNGGSAPAIENAYFNYMNWSDRLDALMLEYC